MRRNLLSSIGVVLLAALLVPASARGAAAPTIEVRLFDGYVRGTGTAMEPIEVVLVGADGARLAAETVVVGKRGRYAAQVPALHPGPGETIIVTQDGRRRSLVVPDIRPSVDREHDRITGRAAPGSRVRITVYRGPLCCGPDVRARETVRAGPDGRYRLDLAGRLDLVAPNEVGIVTRVGRHTVSALVTAPWLNIDHRSVAFVGAGTPASAFPLDLLAPDGTRRLRVHLASDPIMGWFSGLFQDRAGRPVYPRPGDRLARPGVPDIVMPRFRLGGDAATGVLRGRCIPNEEVEVWIGGQERITITDPDGRFTMDLAAGGGFRPHAEWTVLCYWAERDRYVAVGRLP